MLETDIETHALSDPTREVCGLVLKTAEGFAIVRCENTHPDPVNFFRIDPALYAEHLRTGALVGYYHSHPNGSAEASETDRDVAHEVAKPCFIYSVPDRVLNCYVAPAHRAPLVGRPFMPWVHDCISLVWDYFATVHNYALPFFPRTQADYRGGTKVDFRAMMRAYQANFVTTPQIGDILVFTRGESAKPNHLGVMIEDGKFVHQCQTSRVDVLAGFWRQRLVFSVRVPLPAVQSPQ